MRKAIDAFFRSAGYGVVGVSADRRKFGNMVYRTMKEKGLTVYPVNPKLKEVEGSVCYPSVMDLPADVRSVVTVVPPDATIRIVADCMKRGISTIWMQKGSDSPEAIKEAANAGIAVVNGECVMMFLEPVHSFHAFHRWVNKLVGAYPR